MKILVVDDQVINRMLLKAMIEAQNGDVMLAESGREALHSLRREPVDMILMDIEMPDMSGVEVTKAIRENNIVSKDIPIIAVTAHTEDEALQEFKSAGMQECLEKPLSAPDLLSLFKRYHLV